MGLDKRACSYLVDACGAKTLAEYTRADALRYRDYLIARGLVGSSVGRVISSIRAVLNFAISEYALDFKNPFVGMYFDKSAGVSKRLPIPIEDILAGSPNPDREMAHSLQHRQATQFIGLSSACTGKYRSDGPKADNALTFKPDHLMGYASLLADKIEIFSVSLLLPLSIEP